MKQPLPDLGSDPSILESAGVPDLLTAKQGDRLAADWKRLGTIDDGARRIWRCSATDSGGGSTLAAQVRLNPREFPYWAREESPSVGELQEDKTGRFFSVPNVLLVCDLMGYDGLADALITTLGGRLGTYGVQAPGKKKVRVQSAGDMHAAIARFRGDLWGFMVFAHGDVAGNLFATRRGNVITTAEAIRRDLSSNGFQLAKLWMMQCHSAANGRAAWWQALCHRSAVAYRGVNCCGIDLG